MLTTKFDVMLAVGSGNTVSGIPYYLGGGISIYTPLIGFGAENRYRVRAAHHRSGRAGRAHRTSHPELLWACAARGSPSASSRR
jgi:hypothetical protein